MICIPCKYCGELYPKVDVCKKCYDKGRRIDEAKFFVSIIKDYRERLGDGE